jgi:choline dehydrogenase-like flavoprotein
MPIIDANEQLLEGDWTGFDVVIVGAGAAGIFLAVSLARRRLRVLLIESGHFTEDGDRQELNDIEQTGKAMANALWNRKRILGGTTTAWGGGTLPFSPLDFKKRDWIEHSGWPITYDTLSPYFSPVNRFMGVDDRNYDSDILELFNREKPGFDPALVDYHYCKWNWQPDFFKLARRSLKREATVLYNAHLLRIDLGEGGQVAQVEVGDFRGRRRSIPARDLVLATGGIEANRILLLNDHQVKGGLGSGSGWLGKAFMEHPCLVGGHVESDDMVRLQECFGTRLRGLRRYSVRLSASAAWQEKHRLLNVSASLMWLYDGDDAGPIAAVKSLARRPRLDGAMEVAARSGQLARILWKLVREGLIYKPGTAATISLMCEQEPLRDSYVALSDRRDSFGARKALLHWRIGQRTWDTAVRYSETLAAELQRLGLGKARLTDDLRLGAPDYEARLSDVNHHMGGTRMSETAAGGVVNDQLQVWGIPNLYVCSSAVFPTASHSNPTLTLLALAARLAERLVVVRGEA